MRHRRHHVRRRVTATLAVATALGLAACAQGPEDEQTLQVGAAASLREAFEEISRGYEAEHRHVSVELQFAGSSDIAAQVRNGADFDVFASADEATMDLVSEDIAGEPTTFATNTLTIVTEPGNPEDITGLADLDDVTLDVVACAPQVPCGTAAQRLSADLDIMLTPVSEESSVTDVLAKVTSGEADAGLVYVTDAAGAGSDVATVPIEGADEAPNRYPIAVLTQAPSQEAQDFVDLVTGPQGRRVLTDHGFGLP